jgi:hypothetical protein
VSAPICAECGKPLGGGRSVLELGLTRDLDATYHAECFGLRERRFAREKRTGPRRDTSVFTEPGYGVGN